MIQSPLNLPKDVETLQTMVVELRTKLDQLTESHSSEVKHLVEQLRLLRHALYCGKSERHIPADGCFQASLFDDHLGSETAGDDEPHEVEEITVPAHKRKKRGRKPLDENLPRVEIEHDLSEDQKVCGCGHQMSRIGADVSEQLEMFPAVFWVIRNTRFKYACKNCEGVDRAEGESSVQIAPAPVQLIPKSISTPSVLAHLFVSKFSDSLPFYRQEQQFFRYGVKLSRATMCNWAVKVAESCERLKKLLQAEVLSGPVIQVDETRVQVLKEPDRGPEKLSYMWVFLGGPPGKKVVFYHYSQSRGGRVAVDFLGDYQGCVQSDGYSGYDFLDRREGIVHAGCWAHVRRKFFDIIKLLGKKKKNKGKAGTAIKMIRELYQIEREAVEASLTPQELFEIRQKESKPKVKTFFDWVQENALTTSPSGSLGEAFTYALKQKKRLEMYLEHSELTMDNNHAENAIRPFVIGRKNWLFSDRPHGAEASALLYSIIETAKANNLEPYRYLLFLFDKLPLALSEESDEPLKRLLPFNVNTQILEEHKDQYFKRKGSHLI